MMRRALLAAALAIGAANPAWAQDTPPNAEAAHALGGLAHMLSVASPCFPRQGGDAELWRMLHAALARLQGHPELEEAFYRGRTLASQQQRHIGRSDPVACAQVRAALLHITQGR